jgi:hypothetical protein
LALEIIYGNLTGILKQKLSNICHFISISDKPILLSRNGSVHLIVKIALILADDTLNLSWANEFLYVLLQEFLCLSNHIGLFLRIRELRNQRYIALIIMPILTSTNF